MNGDKKDFRFGKARKSKRFNTNLNNDSVILIKNTFLAPKQSYRIVLVVNFFEKHKKTNAKLNHKKIVNFVLLI